MATGREKSGIFELFDLVMRSIASLKQGLDAARVGHTLTSEIVQCVDDPLVLVLARNDIGYVCDAVTRRFCDARDVTNTKVAIDSANFLRVSKPLIARRPV